MKSEIAGYLKMYREIRKISQLELAKHLDISASAYNHYENGNREPSIEILTKLAKFYNLEDQILGVYKSNFSVNHVSKKYNMQELENSLSLISDVYKIDKRYKEKELTLFPSQYETLVEYFKNYDEYKKDVFHDIISSKITNRGKIYEAIIYAWLEQQGIQFEAQKNIAAEDCLKRNGYTADGIIDDWVVFDIKMFGITNPNISKLQTKLNKISKNKHEGYYITIGGSIDISNDILQNLLSQTQELYDNLFNNNNKCINDYIYKIPNTGLEIRAHQTMNKRMISTISEFNPYKWARDNQYYFFHDASQYCTNKPFVIICPYDRNTASLFVDNISDFTHIAFRSLCRRMFIGMPDDVIASNYDSACIPLISMRAASQCISAVIFQDVTDLFDNRGPWIFVNPNATHKLPQIISDQFRFQSCSLFEDFSYDNY